MGLPTQFNGFAVISSKVKIDQDIFKGRTIRELELDPNSVTNIAELNLENTMITGYLTLDGFDHSKVLPGPLTPFLDYQHLLNKIRFFVPSEGSNVAVIYPEPNQNVQRDIVQEHCSHLNDYNYPRELMSDLSEVTLRFIHFDLSTRDNTSRSE